MSYNIYIYTRTIYDIHYTSGIHAVVFGQFGFPIDGFLAICGAQ